MNELFVVAGVPAILIVGWHLMVILENRLHHHNRRRMRAAWDAEWEATQASDTKAGSHE